MKTRNLPASTRYAPEMGWPLCSTIAAGDSRTAALRNVRIPTLVVHGSEDKLIDPSGGRRTAEVVPGARFVLLDGMGHDYPPAYWDEIVRLVTEHARAAAS